MAKLVVKRHCEVCKRKIHSGWFEQHLKSKGHLSKLNPDARAYAENPFPEEGLDRFEEQENLRKQLESAYQQGYEAGVLESNRVITVLNKFK